MDWLKSRLRFLGWSMIFGSRLRLFDRWSDTLRLVRHLRRIPRLFYKDLGMSGTQGRSLGTCSGLLEKDSGESRYE